MPNGYRSAVSRRALRYRLTLVLHGSSRPLTVPELVEYLERVGHPAPHPAAKSVSDSLRWEIGRGRVVRVWRGVYAAGWLDRRTAWWMRRQLEQWEAVERVSESQPPAAGLPTPVPPSPDAAPPWLTALRPDLAPSRPVDRVSE